MAIVMPMVGYFLVYRPLTRGAPLTSRRRPFAAGLGGYIGLNVAALCAATEFGLQPSLFHRADGTPLYAPFHLSQTIPTMALAHLSVAGAVEFALTAGVIAYLQRANLPLLKINHDTVSQHDTDAVGVRKRFGWRWAVLAVVLMGALTPLGLIAPGSAFGEDKAASLNLRKYHLNAVPDGLRHYAGFWHHALFNGYDFKHDRHPSVGYLLSAGAGIAFIALAVLAVFTVLRYVQRRRSRGDPLSGAPA
jgi:cobalt/nickel transport system permease protein